MIWNLPSFMFDRRPKPKLRTTFDDLIETADTSELKHSHSDLEISSDFMEQKNILHDLPEGVLEEFVDKEINSPDDFVTDSEGPIIQLNDKMDVDQHIHGSMKGRDR